MHPPIEPPAAITPKPDRFTPPVPRRRFGFRIAAGVLLLLGGTCYAWIHDATTQTVHAYKPAEAVERGNRDELDDRASAFRDEAATINLEWFTYDNEVIDRPPYKLRIDIDPKRPDLRRAMIDEVRIRSSVGAAYAFADTLRWPVPIEIDPETGGSVLLEPAFWFGYGEGEEITTRIRLRMVTDAGERPVVLETRWVPVRVIRFVPIV